jgi:hypothetical protein
MLNFLNNTAPPKRFVSINNRASTSDLPESFWHSIAENSCDINWKNIPDDFLDVICMDYHVSYEYARDVLKWKKEFIINSY